MLAAEMHLLQVSLFCNFHLRCYQNRILDTQFCIKSDETAYLLLRECLLISKRPSIAISLIIAMPEPAVNGLKYKLVRSIQQKTYLSPIDFTHFSCSLPSKHRKLFLAFTMALLTT
jgi:hypothetical protein